ncbi:MAG TPA: AI-2E family transporter [Opitutaceae bacterium]|nr:AI-2E family transporter [Opitutaceae bacterium]
MNSTPAPAPTATRNIVIAISLLALAVLVWRIADVFVIGFGGFVIAALLRALAVPLAAKTGWSERWSLMAVVFALIVVFVLLGWLFGNQAQEQATELQQQLPQAWEKFLTWLDTWQIGQFAIDSVQHALGDSKTLSNVGLVATAAFATVANLLLILFLGVYFAVDPPLYRAGALRLLPPAYRGRTRGALDDAGNALRKWLLAQVLAMISVGVLAGVGLALVGLPLAFALGVVAAVFEFIPVIGPILFSIPGLLLAFAKGPHTALYVLLVYIVVQQLESNVIIPLLQRWAVELPPVIGLLAIVAGGYLFGVMGVVFATPMVVVVMSLVRHLYVEETLENHHRPAPRRRTAATST